VIESTVGMVGDLQAIAGKAMPEIPSLDMPLLAIIVAALPVSHLSTAVPQRSTNISNGDAVRI
jgi:hypothetical protein